MRVGILALLGAATLLMGAPCASAQSITYPVSGTTRLVSMFHQGYQTGDALQVREYYITESLMTIETPDGPVTMPPSYNYFIVSGTLDETGRGHLTGYVFPLVGTWPNLSLAGYTARVSIQRFPIAYDEVHHIGTWRPETHYVIKQPSGETLMINETGLMRGTVGSFGDYVYTGTFTGKMTVPTSKQLL